MEPTELATFEKFTFKIGQRVQSRANGASYIVIGRVLYESPEGIVRMYTVSNIDTIRSSVCEFELEKGDERMGY